MMIKDSLGKLINKTYFKCVGPWEVTREGEREECLFWWKRLNEHKLY